MTNLYFSNDFVLNRTREMIHYFLDGKLEDFMCAVSDDFVWIGDYDALYTKGADAFMKNIQKKNEMPDILVSEEEYSLLMHEHTLWITYGRCVVETTLPNQDSIIVKFHFTMTLKRFKDELKLIHAMACHIPDATANPENQVLKSKVFGETMNYRQALFKQNSSDKKLVFRDSQFGITHYLYPNEILYIMAQGTTCFVYTHNNHFSCYRRLKSFTAPEFYPISKSYLINRMYVLKLERYTVTMTNGARIPVSRSLYMDFKKILGK